MSLRKFGLVVGLLFLLPLTVQAADQEGSGARPAFQESDTTQWSWPAFGLTFDYPSDWTNLQQQGFDFLLVAPSETPENANFVGMQSALLTGDQTLQGLFDQFAEQYSSTVEGITFGGLDALSLSLPADDSGRQALLIGFEPDEHTVALMIFSAQAAEWEAFSTQIDAITASAVVDILVLDVAELDAQLDTSFQEDQHLRLGDADAPIRMVEVLDFSCPHCVEYSPSVQRLIQDYVLTGNLTLEFKFVTFVGGELSEMATTALFCGASQGVAWQAQEALFKLYTNQQGAQAYNAEDIQAAFAEFIPNEERLATCLAEKPFADLITRNAQEAADLDVESTPSLLFATGDGAFDFIRNSNDEPARGGLSLPPLYQYLDGLLADAG